MKQIPLSNSKRTFTVDDEDSARVAILNWFLLRTRTGKAIATWINNRNVNIGSFILSVDTIVDHKDRNVFNNQKSNLRPASKSQNNANKKPLSGYKGISYRKDRGTWRARIQFREEQIWLGTFTSEIEAAKAYDKAAKQYFGEFAYLNFPEKAEGASK